MNSKEATRIALVRRLTATTLLLLAASAAPAVATQRAQPTGPDAPAHGSGMGPAGAPVNAPEINPALATGAAVLLLGGVLILTSRRRRSKTS